MGATATFLNIYASRCGATPQQIGLLTAVPALIALFISLPLGQWLRRFPAQPVTVWAAFASRILFVFYPFLPQFFPINQQFGAILVLAALIAIPSTVINISFYQFFMEAVPSDWRGTVVGARSAIGSIISLIITLLCGQILTRLAFPLGYQVVFGIGFAGAILTVYQLAHIHPIDPRLAGASLLEESTPAIPAPAPAHEKRFFPIIARQGRNYLRVIGLLFLFNLINSMAAPLIPNLLVHRLSLSDELISFGASTSTLVVLLISLLSARITRRTGNRRGTSIGFGLASSQTIALALAQSAGLYLVSAVLGGVAGGLINVAQYNYHLDNVPTSDRSSWLSMNVLLGSIALLSGALGGPLIAGVLGTPHALILFGGLELAVGLGILKWG